MLEKTLKNLFSPSVRIRGEAYFEMRRASLVSRDKNRVCFTVSGSRNYQCLFKRRGSSVSDLSRSLDMYCECPYFRDYDYCKHLWACIREGEFRGVWERFWN